MTMGSSPAPEPGSKGMGCVTQLLILLAAAALGVVWIMLHTAAKTRATEQAMGPLIRAAESFHEKTGKYPEGLQELIPAYLAEHPKCPDGKNAQYIKKFPLDTPHPGPAVGQDGFIVTCYTFMFTKHTYDSEKHAWFNWD